VTEENLTPRKPLRLAVLQSNYIPWKGYFDIIHDVDLFIFYDCVQFTPRDWRTRNRVKTSSGPLWLTVPVGPGRNRSINEVTIPDAKWQAKHWQSLAQNYGKCAHFPRYKSYFEELYLGRTWTSLSDLNQQLIVHISREFLGISTKFEDSRVYGLQGQKLNRLLDLVRMTGATSYLSGPAAKDYIEPSRFEEIGVELVWKDYSGYPVYPQRFPPFEHGVTVLDLLFNVGPEAPALIWGWR
jgi:hypothetical protein